MPPVDDQVDLDLLLRDAIFNVAVQAYSSGVGISAHVDSRLPVRIQGNAKELEGFLKQGLTKTLKAGGTDTLAIAIWLDKSRLDNRHHRILLEICRRVPAGTKPLTSLADLWASPVGNQIPQPMRERQQEAAEAVMIPLPCIPDTGFPSMAEKWIDACRDRYLLIVPGPMFDEERAAASFAAAGLERVVALTPGQALKMARTRVEMGLTVDFLVLEGQSLGAAAFDLAKAFRADSRLSKTQIVLTGNTRDVGLTENDAALFDALQQVSLPWRRLMQLLYDLSIAQTQAPARRQQGEAKPGALPSLEGRRILIAEDVETNQMLLQTVLAPTGAEVEVVADGATVVKRQAEAPADLILMDLQMPGMGGIEAVRRLRAMGGAAAEIPVMALTAYVRSADRKVAMEAGMNAFLAKPIVVAELYDLLHQLLPEK